LTLKEGNCGPPYKARLKVCQARSPGAIRRDRLPRGRQTARPDI